MQPSELFEQILQKPGMFISGRSLIQAAAFMGGYIHAQWKLGIYNEEDIFHGFQSWIQKRFNIESTQGWQNIITFFSADEEDAFEMAKVLWKEYQSQHQLTNSGLDQNQEDSETRNSQVNRPGNPGDNLA